MNLQGKDIKVFAGNSNMVMAEQICKSLGMPLGNCTVGTFSDGEITVSINESVRGSDVFVIQSTCQPVNNNIMELLIMIDAFKRASAGRITAVIPYFGYARQDRKAKARDPISAKLCADLIATAGADRVLTMDLHAVQIEGFFNIPVDHLLGVPLLSSYFIEKFKDFDKKDLIVVSPDLGSVTRARKFAERLDCQIAIIDKRRPMANVSEVMNIIGDTQGKTAIIVDDVVDTAGTICNAASALLEKGKCTKVYGGATHAVLSGKALENIKNSVFEEMVLLDTIALPQEKKIDKIKTISAAPIFGEAIKRIHGNTSVSPLFL